MADRNLLNDLTDQIGSNIKDKLEDKLDPAKAFSASNLKKKRGAFWTCLIAAFLMVLLAAAGSLAYNMTKVSLFEEGILNHVDLASLGVDESSAKSFAVATIAYLQDTVGTWEPIILVRDHVMPIPQAFKDHMATVKGWVSAAKGVMLAGLAIVLLLLGRALIGQKGGRKSPFSLGGYYLGALIPLLAIAGLGVWATVNFDGLWAWLHTTFIPDGIFNAAEPIMQLFPLQLFAGYLRPVGTTFGVCVAVILALPLLLAPLSQLLTNLFGKESASRKRPAARRAASRAAARGSAAKRKSASAGKD